MHVLGGAGQHQLASPSLRPRRPGGSLGDFAFAEFPHLKQRGEINAVLLKPLEEVAIHIGTIWRFVTIQHCGCGKLGLRYDFIKSSPGVIVRRPFW